MNYIGSKLSLCDFIENSIMATLFSYGIEKKNNELTFADLFAGTGAIGAKFKKNGFNVVANDIQYYSFVTNKHYIENTDIKLPNKESNDLFNHLTHLSGLEGYIYKNYSLGGTKGTDNERMYFSDENALLCDAMRMELEKLIENKDISEGMYYYALASLLNAIDKVANTASVYGAFLKKLKKSAQKRIDLKPLEVIDGQAKYQVFNDDINKVIKKLSGDILYLDPPYNERQYCANYHMLETISKYDNPVIKGKTGLRDYQDQKSAFCSSRTVVKAFNNLINDANFKFIFLSYNNEGLMPLNTIKEIMSEYGEYRVYTQEYKRFKADKDENRAYDAEKTIEYLHCLIKK